MYDVNVKSTGSFAHLLAHCSLLGNHGDGDSAGGSGGGSVAKVTRDQLYEKEQYFITSYS